MSLLGWLLSEIAVIFSVYFSAQNKQESRCIERKIQFLFPFLKIKVLL